jgi:hypothetical protein
MRVETESPKVVEERKFLLEMLFSEGNHYCPFCESSGDCELQALAYRYGMLLLYKIFSPRWAAEPIICFRKSTIPRDGKLGKIRKVVL